MGEAFKYQSSWKTEDLITWINNHYSGLTNLWQVSTDQTLLTGDKSGSFDLTTTGDITSGNLNAEEVIGSEMIANADFDTDTLFTTEHGTITWATGSYTFLASAIKSQAFSDMLIIPSAGVKRYKYEFVVSAASGTSKVFFPHYPSVSVDIGGAGTYTGEFDAEITDPFKFGTGGSGNSSVTVDSISIKEITKGDITADQRMYAQRFVTEGGTSTQVVLGDGTLGSALFLDQTTPQTISNGMPNFAGGIQVDGTAGIQLGETHTITFDGTNLRFTTSLERNGTDYDIGTISNPWNYVYANYFVGDGSGLTGLDFSGFTTDDLTEGSTNLYFSGKTTDDLTQGSTNLYYADSLVDTWLTGKTTDDLTEGSTNLYFNGRDTDGLSEGSTNLYYTDGRVDSWLTNKGGYTGDLNDSTSTKIADVVDGLITTVYF